MHNALHIHIMYLSILYSELNQKCFKNVQKGMLSIDFDIFFLSRETKVSSKGVSLKELRNSISLQTQSAAYFLVYRNTHSPVI